MKVTRTIVIILENEERLEYPNATADPHGDGNRLIVTADNGDLLASIPWKDVRTYYTRLHADDIFEGLENQDS